MGTVKVNGKTYHGNNISVINGKIIVDGKEQLSSDCNAELKIVVNGQVDKIITDRSVTVKGNISGNIECGGSCSVDGSVGGEVDCGGSCNVGGSVLGDIDAGGSVSIKGRK